MPFWRRSAAARVPARTPAFELLAAPAVALPEPPAVPPPPADAAAVGALLGLDGVELLGTAGDLPVWAVEERSGEAALDRWRQLRAQHPRTGLWPVVLGPRDELVETFSFVDGGEHEPDAVAVGTATTATEALLRLVDEEDRGRDDPLAEQPQLPARLEELPEQLDPREGPSLVALVPAAAGWQVPGLVSWWGGANYDIGPADHVAVLRDWEARYGAELVVLTSDVVELAVSRPPTAAAEVVLAARRQYAYCPDGIDQGVGSLDALCREQVVRRSWYFWWD